MIDRELEARLRALEEFVSNCFTYREDRKYDSGIRFNFITDTEVDDQIDPEYKDYLKRLTKSD